MSREDSEAVEAALTGDAPQALYELDQLWAPFYCPECRADYCVRHWDVRPVFEDDPPNWFDYSYGFCPRGHRRMLED